MTETNHDEVGDSLLAVAEILGRTLVLAEVKVLGVVCELEIPEVIEAGETHPDAIARRVGADPDAVDRMLRMLASQGWFDRGGDGTYLLNARSRLLRIADTKSMRDWVCFMAADWHWDIWNHAADAVRTGRSAAVAATGQPFFDWMHEHRPGAAATFDGAMQSISAASGPLVVMAVDLDGVDSVCDVGGGTGRLLRTFLEADPSLTGTVFDLEEVIGRAGDVLAPLPAHRWATVAGSFFERGAIPTGHDRYLMQAIMHDWDDDAAGRILDNVHAAMSGHGRLWVVDNVLDPDEAGDMAKPVDLLMLALTEGGRERTQPEWDRLFSAHGFRIEAQVHVGICVFTLVPT